MPKRGRKKLLRPNKRISRVEATIASADPLQPVDGIIIPEDCWRVIYSFLGDRTDRSALQQTSKQMCAMTKRFCTRLVMGNDSPKTLSKGGYLASQRIRKEELGKATRPWLKTANVISVIWCRGRSMPLWYYEHCAWMLVTRLQDARPGLVLKGYEASETAPPLTTLEQGQSFRQLLDCARLSDMFNSVVVVKHAASFSQLMRDHAVSLAGIPVTFVTDPNPSTGRSAGRFKLRVDGTLPWHRDHAIRVARRTEPSEMYVLRK